MHRAVNLIVIHCSASADGKTLFEGKAEDHTLRTSAQVIDRWHVARGFQRSAKVREIVNPQLEAIGYHWVIDTDGGIEMGRHVDEVGAHCVGQNAHSVGICVLGTQSFTLAQWASLKTIVEAMKLKYPGARICGRRDLSPDKDGDGLVEPPEWVKTSPGFDVAGWLSRDKVPLPENIFYEPLKEPA